MASSHAIVLSLVLVLLSQTLAARIRRDEGAQSPDLLEGVREQIRVVGSEMNRALGLPESGASANEIKTVFENKARELEDRAKGFIEEANRQLETRRDEMSESTATALIQAQQHINASVEQLRTQAQNAPTTLEAFHQNFARTVETLMEENGKLARAAGEDAGAAHEQLSTLARDTMNGAMSFMRNFATEIQSHANKASGS